MTALDPVTMTVHLPIVVRVAVPDDLSKLEWFGQYAHFRRVFRRTFQEQQQGRRVMLIADCNDFPIGHIFVLLRSKRFSVGDGDPRAYLYSLRVMDMFRGQGIGTRLIAEAEIVICKRGIPWAMIAVAKQNLRARQLYERLGYQIVADDAGQWTFTDHLGKRRFVSEPSWVLEKRIG